MCKKVQCGEARCGEQKEMRVSGVIAVRCTDLGRPFFSLDGPDKSLATNACTPDCSARVCYERTRRCAGHLSLCSTPYL